MIVKAVIEMTKGSPLKYEVDKYTGKLVLDRMLNQLTPQAYGFVPHTHAPDGDPLDIFVVCETVLNSGLQINQVILVGVLTCLDNDVADHKLIGVVKGSYYEYHLEEVRAKVTAIERFLNSYKDGFQVTGYHGLSQAINEYNKSIQLYKSLTEADLHGG